MPPICDSALFLPAVIRSQQHWSDSSHSILISCGPVPPIFDLQQWPGESGCEPFLPDVIIFLTDLTLFLQLQLWPVYFNCDYPFYDQILTRDHQDFSNYDHVSGFWILPFPAVVNISSGVTRICDLIPKIVDQISSNQAFPADVFRFKYDVIKQLWPDSTNSSSTSFSWILDQLLIPTRSHVIRLINFQYGQILTSYDHTDSSHGQIPPQSKISSVRLQVIKLLITCVYRLLYHPNNL